MIIPRLWERLAYLVPEPQCSTREDDYDSIVWNDGRTLPTQVELQAIPDADLDANMLNIVAEGEFEQKMIKALAIETLQELRALGSTTTGAEFKQKIKDRYKTL